MSDLLFRSIGSSYSAPCRGKTINSTFSECVFVALRVQHAKRMRCIALSSPTSLAPSCFYTLSHKRQDFREKKLMNIKFVFWFCLQICLKRSLFEEELSERLSSMHKGLYVKYPLVLSGFNETWFSRQIFEEIKISDFMKIRLLGAELFHADGQTDTTKLILDSCNLGTCLQRDGSKQ
jgi:hypothetical protein